MPKSNFLRKKSKTGATADFKRLKAKVGKRAPQAASHTDTSFKSKRVRVSAQSILHDLGDEDAVTARGQGVQELLVQLRHYSPTSRREALAGLKTVVDRHRTFAEVNFARLTEPSLELAVCFDNDVRKALLSFQEALLDCVSGRTFAPFANLYTAYIVSAMTSLDGGVRRDSLSLLTLLLGRFPAVMAERTDRLAPNYASLLAVDPASKKQTGRADALKSLVGLFRAVSQRYGRSRSHGGGSASRAIGGGDGNDTSGLAYDSSTVRMTWKQGSRRNSALMLYACAAPVASGMDNRGATTAADAPAIALMSTLPQILERLREIWIESLAAIPPNISMMQNIVDVLLEAIASPAWDADEIDRNGGQDWGRGTGGTAAGDASGGGKGRGTSTQFARFVRLILEAFPMRPLEGELLGDVEAERLRAIDVLNMGLCELVVAACTGPAAIASAAADTGVAGTKGDVDDDGGGASDWLAPVLAHVHEVLRDGVGMSGEAGPQIPSVLRVLSAATQSQAGRSKSSAGWVTQRQSLLSAFGTFFKSLPPRAEAKLLCVTFICSLSGTLLSGSPGRDVRRGGIEDAQSAREVRGWIQTFPELLCRWEGEFPTSSAAALRALGSIAKHTPSSPLPLSCTTKSCVTALSNDGKANKGKAVASASALANGTSDTGGRGGAGEAWAKESAHLLRSIKPELLGDFFAGRGFPSLPKTVQMDAVSLLYHLPCVSPPVLAALAGACSDPAALHGDVRSFVLEVIHHRRRSLSPSAYLGFLVSVLMGFKGAKGGGGAKRTATQAEDVGERSHSAGKRRRRISSTETEDRPGREDATGVEEGRKPGRSAPSSLWETVFARDGVTGAVCNSLAMIGTRGGALLEALQPTLLQLLRRGRNGSVCTGGNDSVAVVDRSRDGDDSLGVALQGERAAMACLLCCWEGLEVDSGAGTPATPATALETLPARTTTATTPIATKSTRLLSALERPMAAACVRAMRTAGTMDAAQQARGARLLRPVIVLVKRWPALMPAILTSILSSTANVTAASNKGASGGSDTVVGVRSLESLLRCLQCLVRDSGLQGQLRRRHVGALRAATGTLCATLDGSPLKDLVVQLRADVELLGGGRVEDI